MAKLVKTMSEFNAYFRQESTHPLVSVGDLSRADLSLFEPLDFGMYCVVLMDDDFGELIKGGKSVRYRAGTLFSLRPGQDVAMNLDYTVRPSGWMLAFRPEFIARTGLGRDLYMFSFFESNINEALELSATERGVILNCFANIFAELHTPTDYLSDHLIRLGIGQLLSYFKRFYERQFKESSVSETSFVHRLDKVVDNYLSSGMSVQKGHPTVAWCASQFNISANYFGDVVKRELHITAQDYIHSKIVNAAKTMLLNTNLTINEVAEELGFTYPNHFTRMFSRHEGISPSQFRRNSNKPAAE